MADEWQRENLKGAIQLASQTIKSLELANGGAAIALLTFYGNSISHGTALKLSLLYLRVGLICFAAGLFLAVVCAIFAYFSQLGTAIRWREATEVRLRLIAIGAGVVSALLFASGVVSSALAIG
jgi:hypothetical protein